MIDNWNCDICGENRPDEFISVNSKDMSEEFGFTPGVFRENVKYCNDKHECIKGSRTYSRFTKESAQKMAQKNLEKINEHYDAIVKKGEQKEKFNIMRYVYTFLIVFALAMILNPLFSVLIHEDATFLGKMLDPIGVTLRLAIAGYISWRFTDKLFPQK
jgi:hypothetical protein